MKAAILDIPGGIPVCREMPEPVPAGDQQFMYVKASSIKNIDRMLAGDTHYDRYRNFPVVVGTDGVGVLEDGRRVYIGSKNGMMAEKVIINKKWFVPIPDKLDFVLAAALPNPAVSAWLSLQWKGQLKKDDAVLILGATGITGRLAIQLAKHLGAGNVVALGRNPKILDRLTGLGADKVISLNQSFEKIQQEINAEIRKKPFGIVLDYLWGRPAEEILDILTGRDLEAEGFLTRWIQIGEMAGPSIRLNASTLRSSGIEICGQGGGGLPPEIMASIPTVYLPEIFNLAVNKKITIDTETILLGDIRQGWSKKNEEGKRTVVII